MYDRGAITINEYRELLYYEPIEDGDVRMVSLNYVKEGDQSQYQVGSSGQESTEGEPEGKVPAAYVLTERLQAKDIVTYIQTKKKEVRNG